MPKNATIEKEVRGEEQIVENTIITIQEAEREFAEIKRGVATKELSFKALSELANSLRFKINQRLKMIHVNNEQDESNDAFLALNKMQKDLAKLVAGESTMKLLENTIIFRTMSKLVLTLNLEGKKGKS